MRRECQTSQVQMRPIGYLLFKKRQTQNCGQQPCVTESIGFQNLLICFSSLINHRGWVLLYKCQSEYCSNHSSLPPPPLQNGNCSVSNRLKHFGRNTILNYRMMVSQIFYFFLFRVETVNFERYLFSSLSVIIPI